MMNRASVPGNSWRRRAACIGTRDTLWFDVQSPTDRDEAKAICLRCPVRRICLDVAMAEEHNAKETPAQNLKRRHGIRGAMTAFERFESVYPVEAARVRDELNARQRAGRARKSAVRIAS